MDLAQKLNQENFKSPAFKDIKKYLIANFLSFLQYHKLYLTR